MLLAVTNPEDYQLTVLFSSAVQSIFKMFLFCSPHTHCFAQQQVMRQKTELIPGRNTELAIIRSHALN